ncbi:MAG: iron-sulfur cluster assembly scaffold protein [bacterium]|nr:iron-sulfur cluster assembly scaffold protein [bacterium]
MADKKDIDVINQYTGESWYYTDIVKDHFFHPRNLLFEKPKDENEFDARGMVGSPACILPSTLIQKNPKMAEIKEAIIGEKVLSHDGKFNSIKRIFRPKYKDTLVKIYNPWGILTATNDHLIFAIQAPRTKSFYLQTKYKKRIMPTWVHAGDLRRGDVALYPIPKIIKPLSKITLPIFPKNKFDFKSKDLPKYLPINEEVLELFGYFVAEGHTRKWKGELGFTFSIKERAYVEKVCKLIKKYFRLQAAVRERPANNRIDIAIYNIYLAQLFRFWFGENAKSKKVPEFVLFLEPKIQRGFIRGLWRGDGYFSGERSQPRAGFTSISETLLHQLKWLLVRQRIIPSIYREMGKTIGGIKHQKSYRMHVGDMASLERLASILDLSFIRNKNKRHAEEVWHDGNYIYLPVRRTEIILFKGRLFNFEINDTHTYATDAFLVHNCGDMMEMWMKVKGETIAELKWKTFGCASAIAATSMYSVMLTENGGMTLAEALKVRPQDVMKRLGGLPNRKIHCSVLADKAFQKTANDYFRKTGQNSRIVIEGARVIDPRLNITDKDIEEAVLEGAQNLEEVQKKLKVGVGASQELITEIEQLIRFYADKYYG